MTMGSYDGAKISDVVGLFLLSKVQNLGFNLGAYRDNWLGYSWLTARQTDVIKKQIKKIFNEHGLKVEIQVNKDVVDFLEQCSSAHTQTVQLPTIYPKEHSPERK